MATLTTQQKLDDARDKYHKLNTGTLRVTVRDGNTTVEYTEATKDGLLGYITELENQLAVEADSSKKPRAPAGVIF